MSIGYRFSDIQNTIDLPNTESRVFNPDKRIDAGQSNEPKSFNPDKRLDISNTQTDASEDIERPRDIEAKIDEVASEYLRELKKFSEVPDTISNQILEVSELKRLLSEEVCALREEFDDNKAKLRHQWELKNGREWPIYEQDVLNERGDVVRKAGTCYDAHHIKPLSLGGRNEADNITPLSMEMHQGKQGIHRRDGACNELVRLVKERQS